MAVLLWSFKQQISHMLGSIWQSFSQSSAIILQRVSWPPATSTTRAGYIIDRERVDESFKNVLISLFSLISEYESFLIYGVSHLNTRSYTRDEVDCVDESTVVVVVSRPFTCVVSNDLVVRVSGSEKQKGLFEDRKSTRLNSSHLVISYAVFCLKKKKHTTTTQPHPSYT